MGVPSTERERVSLAVVGAWGLVAAATQGLQGAANRGGKQGGRLHRHKPGFKRQGMEQQSPRQIPQCRW